MLLRGLPRPLGQHLGQARHGGHKLLGAVGDGLAVVPDLQDAQLTLLGPVDVQAQAGHLGWILDQRQAIKGIV